jgi:hypothetical protein
LKKKLYRTLGGNIFLKIVRVSLVIVVIVLSGYSLITQTLELMPYYMFFLGALILVTGLAEIQKDRKGFWGYMNIAISLFVFLASIQYLLMN